MVSRSRRASAWEHPPTPCRLLSANLWCEGAFGGIRAEKRQAPAGGSRGACTKAARRPPAAESAQRVSRPGRTRLPQGWLSRGPPHLAASPGSARVRGGSQHRRAASVSRSQRGDRALTAPTPVSTPWARHHPLNSNALDRPYLRRASAAPAPAHLKRGTRSEPRRQVMSHRCGEMGQRRRLVLMQP